LFVILLQVEPAREAFRLRLQTLEEC